MAIKKIDAWKISNGEVFQVQLEAKKKEAFVLLRDLLESNNIGANENTINGIIAYKDDVITILNTL